MPVIQLTHRLEYRWLGPPPGERPSVVMLHHGLGSVSAWRDFPDRVAEATGLGVLVYSRHGYGESEPVREIPRPVSFMHDEATGDLPELLDALQVTAPILLGHSDGASIAIIYAASGRRPHPLGLVLIAPHVFVEQRTLDGAVAAGKEYAEGSLRDRMARRHADPDGAFRGWHATWLRPDFRDWNIEDETGRIGCPVTVVQGLDDEYGTMEQVDRIRRALGACEAVLLKDCGHLPHSERPDATVAAVAQHVARVVGRSHRPAMDS